MGCRIRKSFLLSLGTRRTIILNTFTIDGSVRPDTQVSHIEAQKARTPPALSGIVLIGTLIAALKSINPLDSCVISCTRVSQFAANPMGAHALP